MKPLNVNSNTTKADLLAAVYTPEELRKIDSAVPLSHWPKDRQKETLWALCTNYNPGPGTPVDFAGGRVENILQIGIARGLTFTFQYPRDLEAILGAAGTGPEHVRGPVLSIVWADLQRAAAELTAAGYPVANVARALTEGVPFVYLNPVK